MTTSIGTSTTEGDVHVQYRSTTITIPRVFWDSIKSLAWISTGSDKQNDWSSQLRTDTLMGFADWIRRETNTPRRNAIFARVVELAAAKDHKFWIESRSSDHKQIVVLLFGGNDRYLSFVKSVA